MQGSYLLYFRGFFGAIADGLQQFNLDKDFESGYLSIRTSAFTLQIRRCRCSAVSKLFID